MLCSLSHHTQVKRCSYLGTAALFFTPCTKPQFYQGKLLTRGQHKSSCLGSAVQYQDERD